MAVHEAGRASVDPTIYTPPPLRPGAEGWHPGARGGGGGRRWLPGDATCGHELGGGGGGAGLQTHPPTHPPLTINPAPSPSCCYPQSGARCGSGGACRATLSSVALARALACPPRSSFGPLPRYFFHPARGGRPTRRSPLRPQPPDNDNTHCPSAPEFIPRPHLCLARVLSRARCCRYRSHYPANDDPRNLIAHAPPLSQLTRQGPISAPSTPRSAPWQRAC